MDVVALPARFTEGNDGMTPTETRLWLQMQRKAAGLSPDMQSAITRAFQNIRDSLSESELVRALQSGYVDQIFDKALSDAVMQQAFQPVRDLMRKGVTDGVKFFSRSLPTKRNVTFSFDSLSPDVVTAIQTLETRVITDLQDSIRETVRTRISQGITEGESVQSIARDLRTVIGLGPSQLQEVKNYRDALLGQNGRNVTDYALRDKRFKGGELTSEQVDRMVARYETRRIAANAETVARTATLDSYKLGQSLSWQTAVDQGIVDGGNLTKTWVGVMDDRERDEHVEMEGETVAYDDTYSNGEDIPGESTYNCRCLSRFSTQ